MSDQATSAVGAQLERHVRPRAWAIFVDSGNARMWTTLQPHVQKLADAEGLEVTPLYGPEALAAERARLTELLRGIAAHNRAEGEESRAICFEQAAHFVSGA